MKGFRNLLRLIAYNSFVAIVFGFIFMMANVASLICCAGLYMFLTAMFGSIDVVANLTGPEIATMVAVTLNFTVTWLFCAWCAVETMEFE